MWGNPNYYGPGGMNQMFPLPPNTTMKDVERFYKLMDRINNKKEEADKKKKDGGKPPNPGFSTGQSFFFFCLISPFIGIGSALYAINYLLDTMLKLQNALPH